MPRLIEAAAIMITRGKTIAASTIDEPLMHLSFLHKASCIELTEYVVYKTNDLGPEDQACRYGNSDQDSDLDHFHACISVKCGIVFDKTFHLDSSFTIIVNAALILLFCVCK
jgi:hypothetical protein